MYGETLDFQCQQWQQQIYCKNWFSDWLFYVTIADADIGSLKSMHTLFDKYLDHMLVEFEQNRMIQSLHTTQILSFLTQNGYGGQMNKSALNKNPVHLK